MLVFQNFVCKDEIFKNIILKFCTKFQNDSNTLTYKTQISHFSISPYVDCGVKNENSKKNWSVSGIILCIFGIFITQTAKANFYFYICSEPFAKDSKPTNEKPIIYSWKILPIFQTFVSRVFFPVNKIEIPEKNSYKYKKSL